MASSFTTLDLGRRVKSKYPGSYDDIPDAELGRKVKDKFPGAYDDFQDWVGPEQSPVDQETISRAGMAPPPMVPKRPPAAQSMTKSPIGKLGAAMEWTQKPLAPISDLPIAYWNPPGQRSINEISQRPESREDIPFRIASGAVKTAESLTTPQNIALGAGAVIAPALIPAYAAEASAIIGGAFTVDMAKNAIEQIPEAAQAAKEKRWGDFAELATQTGLSAGMAAQVGRHAIRQAKVPMIERQSIKDYEIYQDPARPVGQRELARQRIEQNARELGEIVPEAKPDMALPEVEAPVVPERFEPRPVPITSPIESYKPTDLIMREPQVEQPSQPGQPVQSIQPPQPIQPIPESIPIQPPIPKEPPIDQTPIQPQVPGPVGIRQEPGNLPIRETGQAPAATGGVLQAPGPEARGEIGQERLGPESGAVRIPVPKRGGKSPDQSKPSPRELVLRALTDTQESAGLMTPLDRIRDHPLVRSLPKSEVDQALLDLYNNQDIRLHEHSAPMTEPESVRSKFVQGPMGYGQSQPPSYHLASVRDLESRSSQAPPTRLLPKQPPADLPSTPSASSAMSPEQGSLRLSISPQVRAQLSSAQSRLERQSSAAWQKFRTDMVDYLSPVFDFEKGRGLTPEQSAYTGGRLYAGHYGEALETLERELFDHLPKATFLESITPGKKRGQSKLLRQAVEYGLTERIEELSKRTGERTVSSYPKGWSPTEAAAKKAKMESDLGPDGIKQLRPLIDTMRDFSDTMLQKARDEGLISQSQYAAIKAGNEFYIPLNRIADVSDILFDPKQEKLQSDLYATGRNIFSVSGHKLVERVRGSEKEIRDPMQSLVLNAFKTISLIERNKVARKLANYADLPQFKGEVIRLSGDSPAPKGMDVFHVFENGSPKRFAAPMEVVASIKNLNKPSSDIMLSWLRSGTNILRWGAVQSNPAFILPNAVRDARTAFVTSKVGFSASDWVKGFAHALLKDDAYRRYETSEASFSGYYERSKSPQSIVRSHLESPTFHAAKTVLNPFALIRAAGEVIELAPRIGVHERALSKDKSPSEAALISRDATVDFAKAGDKWRVVNLYLPFVNPRLQGAWNSISALRPEDRSKTMTRLIASVGIPAVVKMAYTAYYYPELFGLVDPEELRNYNVIPTGDLRDQSGKPIVDDRGRLKNAIRIPKSEVEKIYGNPLEEFILWAIGQEPRSALSMLSSWLSEGVSPLEFADDEGYPSASRAVASATPPLGRAVYESIQNRELRYGREIIPERLKGRLPEDRVSRQTPPWLQKASAIVNARLHEMGVEKSTGMEPARVEHLVTGLTGGVGRTLLKNPTPAGVAQSIADRFAGPYMRDQSQSRMRKEVEREQFDVTSRHGPLLDQSRDYAKRLQQAIKSDSVDQYQSIVKEIDKKMESLSPSDRDYLDRSLNDAMNQEGKELEGEGDRALDQAAPEVKARRLKRLLDASPDEQSYNRILNEWEQRRWLTPAVEREMDRLYGDQQGHGQPAQSVASRP